jgi:hypothetical protein
MSIVFLANDEAVSGNSNTFRDQLDRLWNGATVPGLIHFPGGADFCSWGSNLPAHHTLVINCHGGIANTTELITSTSKNLPPDRLDGANQPNDINSFKVALQFDEKLKFAEDLAQLSHKPRVLCFCFACCGGWEPSLAQVMLKGGCQYFIGFRTENSGFDSHPHEFFRTWIRLSDSKFTPDLIPAAFAEYARLVPTAYPVLYSRSAGELEAAVLWNNTTNKAALQAMVQVTRVDRLHLIDADPTKKQDNVYAEVGRGTIVKRKN